MSQGTAAPCASALGELGALVGSAAVLRADSEDLTRYELAPNLQAGRAGFVVRPADYGQVREVLRWAVRHGVRLVAQGANSGLVAAGLPDGSEACGVLSTELLRGTFEVDTAARTLTVSAGWQLDEINERLAPDALQLPVEVGSSPAAGGMVGTNTAGSHLVKYGDIRHRVLGLRAVLPDRDTTVIDLLSPLRKRNEGLDLKQLFIGTGGTFGVVTEVAFELAPLPRTRAAAWLAADEVHLSDILRTFELRCGETLAAFEVVSPSAVDLLRENHAELLNRVPAGEHFLALVEIAAPDERAEEKLLAALESVGEEGWLADATLGPVDQMWEVRHTIPDITERMDRVLSLDLSTPRSGIAACRADLEARLASAYPSIEPIWLGHYGDGGLHLILPMPVEFAAEQASVDALRMFVYDIVVREHGGSFSAEHGVGPKNHDAYVRYVPESVRATAGVLKQHFDPHGVLGTIRL